MDHYLAVTRETMSRQQIHSTDWRSENGSRSGQIQVLHVEDDPAFADLAVTGLERAADRLSVEKAPSAAKGSERLGDDIDCIVSDYNMPGMDGIEFLTAVRESYPDLPFILFTGRGSEEVASDAISAGVTDYLQKESGTDQFTVLANRIINSVEKERVHDKLTQQTEELDTVLSHSPLISFAFDADGVFTLSRGKALSTLGFLPGELVGESVFDVFADNADIIAAAESALEGAQTTATHEIADAVYQTTYNPVFDEDGGVGTVTGVAIDITERHERERELRQFKQAIEATSHSVYITDADGTIEYVNPAFETTTGYTAEEAIGRTPQILKSGEHDEEFYEELWETILAGDTWEGELVNATKGGDRYVINQTITPVTDETGEITDFVAVNRDITERVEGRGERDSLREAGRTAQSQSDLFDSLERPAESQRHTHQRGEH
jgi:PAS domain S-box-containing protein